MGVSIEPNTKLTSRVPQALPVDDKERSDQDGDDNCKKGSQRIGNLVT